MNCKDCIHQKKCTKKDTPQKECLNFLRYSESKKFEAYDRMMKRNRGVSMD